MIIPFLIIAALVFGICFAVDRGFTKIFRSTAQHRSGLSVRPSKRYGSFGLILFVVGLGAVFAALPKDWVLLVCGILVGLAGVGLAVYYMTFGIYYDSDSFLLTTFGRKSRVYTYKDICSQQLFNAYGSIIIELHLSDGKTVQLQASMTGVYPFMDTAFSGWCRQTGHDPESCDFHDPANSLWFPQGEE